MKRIWTLVWPTEPGWYWFYGSLYGVSEIGFHPVEVTPTRSGVLRTIQGNFMWASDAHLGLWTKADMPDRPNEDNIVETL